MTIHKIELRQHKSGKDTMSYNSEDIGVSRREPLFDAARILLSMGQATEEDTIETYRKAASGQGLTKCLSATVGVAAKLTVRETDEGFLGFVKWKPCPFKVARLTALASPKDASPGSATLSNRQPLGVVR
jgi:hypothetical protein